MITRPKNWPELLDAHLSFWRWQSFEWGQSDCCHFAASWMRTLGHRDPLAGLPNWASPLAAARLQRAMGGFRAAIASQLAAMECPEIPWTFAMRGDLALVRIDWRKVALGIVSGPNVVCHGSPDPVVTSLLGSAITAWKL